ncbi:MAG: hypothetical protein PGN16_19605 [Sphingomonas phyllosphaerae]|uniref:hypothetical protein n=1 Tax=Sphingomonas phyllosphaerae TaxID=257003 RepID=UPI002FF89291
MNEVRSRLVRKRTAREWALRGALALAASIFGYASTTQTLGYSLVKTDPERAHELAPADGRITGALAAQRVTATMPSAQRGESARLAHGALLKEPLSASALTALGIDADLRGYRGTARTLFVHSNALTRRELSARLWLIEDAVARNDVPGALRNYDIALRTSKSAPGLLFPIMAAAIDNADVAKALADTMRSRPPWNEAFFDFVASSGASPKAAAILFIRLAQSGVQPPESARATIINTLIGADAFENAWAYYKTLRGNLDRRRSTDASFSQALSTPTFFDWTPKNDDPGLTALIERSPQGGFLDFAAPSGIGGTVLQQGLMLPSGEYRLQGSSADLTAPADARPFWRLSCLNKRELGRIDLPDSIQNRGHFSGILTVDAKCPVQVLQLVLRPSLDAGGVSGKISSAMLLPLGSRQ